MVRTALTVQVISRDGLAVIYAAADATNEHEFVNTARDVFIHVKNANASAVALTFITQGTVDGQAIADRTVSVTGLTEEFIGPFNNTQYGSGTAGTTVQIDLDIDTSITLAALQLGSL